MTPEQDKIRREMQEHIDYGKAAQALWEAAGNTGRPAPHEMVTFLMKIIGGLQRQPLPGIDPAKRTCDCTGNDLTIGPADISNPYFHNTNCHVWREYAEKTWPMTRPQRLYRVK
jgi:hypothetical protein